MHRRTARTTPTPRTLSLTCLLALAGGCSSRPQPTDAGADRDAAIDHGAPDVVHGDAADALDARDGSLAPDADAADAPRDVVTHDALACIHDQLPVVLPRFDLHVMLDQSGSMDETVAGGGTRWGAVTGALNSFVRAPDVDGLSVGLQYFGLSPTSECSATCRTDADCGTYGPCVVGLCLGCAPDDSCNPSDYSTAAVEIAPLPGVAPQVAASLTAHAPLTGTPTAPALQGALSHAAAWARAHPDDLVAVALVTDGEPDECTPTDIPGVGAIAASALAATPSVPTYVIGVGTELAALDAIAAAGGTDHAYVVDNAMDVAAQFRAALDGIRLARWGCSFAQPAHDGMLYPADYVNVEFTPSTSTPDAGAPDAGTTGAFVGRVVDAAHCPQTGDAWYWDSSTPPRIVLCGALCARVRADPASSTSVVVGCPTQDAPP